MKKDNVKFYINLRSYCNTGVNTYIITFKAKLLFYGPFLEIKTITLSDFVRENSLMLYHLLQNV